MWYISAMADTLKPLIFSLLDTPAVGGAEHYLLDQLLHLAKIGHPIAVATNHPQVKTMYLQAFHQAGLDEAAVIDAPYRLDAIGNWKGLIKFFLASPAALWWCWKTLHRLRQHYGQVICYWPGWTDRLLFSPIARQLSCYLVWIEIGPLEPLFRRNFGFPKALHRSVRHTPHQIVTTSDWTKKSMIKTGLLAAEHMTLIYPGLEAVTNFELSDWQKKGKAWLFKHQVHQPVISWVGRLAQENELELLLQALSKISEKPDTTVPSLVVIGDGPERDAYENMAVKLGLSAIVTFTGFVSEEEKRAIVAASQLFVFTRAWDLDGFGMTSIEAMNLAVPTITSRFGPQLEIMADQKEGSVGWYFAPHDSDDLAKMISQVLSLSSSTRTLIGKNGQKLVKAKFSQKRALELVTQVIKQAQF